MEIDKRAQRGRGIKEPMDVEDRRGDFESLPVERSSVPGPAKCKYEHLYVVQPA